MTRPILPFDVVVLLEGIPELNIPPGSRAVVLDVYESPSPAFEVEVVNTEGATLFVGAVAGELVRHLDATDSEDLP